jgi:ribosomal protein S18 acetylase RimI-like enzyme
MTTPQYRGRGLGARLLAHVQRDVVQLGLDSIVLHAAPAAASLYMRCGFQLIAPGARYVDEQGEEIASDDDPVLAWVQVPSRLPAWQCSRFTFINYW